MDEATEKRQTQDFCPNCNSTFIVETKDRANNHYWGCDSCGHSWVGKLFTLGAKNESTS